MRRSWKVLFTVLVPFATFASFQTAEGREAGSTSSTRKPSRSVSLTPSSIKKSPEGRILSGPGFAYSLKEPRGWIMDLEAGIARGWNGMLTPQNKAGIGGRMFLRVIPKQRGETAPDLAKLEAQRVRTSQPGTQMTPGAPLVTADARRAIVTHFAPSQRGEHRRQAWIETPTFILLVVIGASSASELKRSIPAFETLVRSFRLVTTETQMDPTRRTTGSPNPKPAGNTQ